MIKLIIPGNPVAKARPRVSKFGTHNTEKTVNYETLIKELFIISRQKKLEGMLKMELDCYFKIPKKTSKVKTTKMLNDEIRPVVRPDIDNIIKIICDGLNGLAYKDDSQIVDIDAGKYYSDTPRVEINIMSIEV